MEESRASFESLRSRLFGEADIENHPLFTSLIEGRFEREAEKEIALEIFSVVSAFPRFLAALLAQIDDWRLRMELAENLFEEHGRSNPAAVHVVTYRAFLCAIGLGDAAIDGHRAGLAATVYVRAVLDLCARHPVEEAVGALAVIEEVVARVSPQVARFGAQRAKGSKLGSHFSAHEVLDVSHANELYDVAARLGASALPGILRGMRLGMYYHTRLYSDLVTLVPQGQSSPLRWVTSG